MVTRRFLVSAPPPGAGGPFAIQRFRLSLSQPSCGLGRRALHHKCNASPASAAVVSTTTTHRTRPGSFLLTRYSMNKSFWKAGHPPTLFAAFLYFDLSFMVWYVLGPLAVQIATDLELTAQQRGLMVATPILAGAVLRFFMGLLADRLSPKTAGLVGQVVVVTALFCAWQIGISSYEQTLLLGLFLGFAGAAFAVSLPLASQWYPPEHQGKAMGIAGAGNSEIGRASCRERV